MNIELLATLLIAHVVGDFALQTDTIYRLKTQGGAQGLLVHVSIHLIVTAILVQGGLEKWLMLLALGVVHYCVDWLKLKANSRPAAPSFVIDQLAHILFLCVLAWYTPNLQVIIPAPWVYMFAVYGLLPVATMCLWVWAHDQTGTPQDSARIASWRNRMKLISQASGWPMTIFLALTVVQTYFLNTSLF